MKAHSAGVTPTRAAHSSGSLENDVLRIGWIPGGYSPGG